MLLLKSFRAACGAQGAGTGGHRDQGQRVLGPPASELTWLMDISPRGPEEGPYLGHQTQRGLVQRQHERPQILQSL